MELKPIFVAAAIGAMLVLIINTMLPNELKTTASTPTLLGVGAGVGAGIQIGVGLLGVS